MLGVGYNFTDYSDDFTDLSYDEKGFFVIVIGEVLRPHGLAPADRRAGYYPERKDQQRISNLRSIVPRIA